MFACVIANDDPANNMAGSSLGAGLWQSDDTGKTWKQLGWKHIKCYSVDVDPRSNGRTLYLAAGNGILKSRDAGLTWKMMTDWRMAEVLDVEVDPHRSDFLYAATAHGFFRSIDSGVTWKRSHTGIRQPYVSRLNVEATAPGTLIVTGEEGSFVSTDHGESWRAISTLPYSRVRDVAKDTTDRWVAATEMGRVEYFGLELGDYGRRGGKIEFWSIAKTSRGIAVGGPAGIKFVSDTAAIAGPKLVHALAQVSQTVFAGTLGDGIWKLDLAMKPKPSGRKNGEPTNSDWSRAGLERSQVWRIKTFEIE